MLAGILSLLVLAGAQATGTDWPTHRADEARSGVARTELSLPMEEVWSKRSLHPPRPAWPGPAKRDAYNKVENLRPRLWFDRAFSVVVADGNLYFGSSADEQVHCLDAATGKERWRFFTEAPVRFAPTWHRGRLYVGSDDGRVYCLDGTDGRELWRRRPGPADRRVPGNGRMMSVWPIRSSVVVRDESAYCCAGLFPSEGVWLCALNARTGKERWKQRLEGIMPQGYLLASERHLYLPTSRAAPVVFDRESGARLRDLGGAGGTWALVVEGDLVHGPGKTGQLSESSGDSAEQVAHFAGHRMIVNEGRAWLQDDLELSCLDRRRFLELTEERGAIDQRRAARTAELSAAAGRRAEKLEEELIAIGAELERVQSEILACVRWRIRCAEPFELILVGDLLFAGGEDRVVAYDAATGEERWRAAVEGKAYSLAAAGGRLFVSTDRGAIHAFESRGGAR